MVRLGPTPQTVSESLKANSLTVMSYITDRWKKHATNVVCFDNGVIAGSYVAPAMEMPAPK